MNKKLSKLETTLNLMESKINAKFKKLSANSRKEITNCNKHGKVHGFNEALKSVIDDHTKKVNALQIERDRSLELMLGIRTFSDMIEAGFMSVGEAVTIVNNRRRDESVMSVAFALMEGFEEISEAMNLLATGHTSGDSEQCEGCEECMKDEFIKKIVN